MEPGGAEGQLAAPPVAPPPPPPAWEAVLHLVLPILASQFDRYSVRLVSREWRGAADHTWQAAALNCSPPGPGPPPPRLASGAFLLPRLRSLSLLEFNTQQQLEDVVGNQLHEVVGSGALPLLRSLELCTWVNHWGQWRLYAGLDRLHLLPQLQRLSLEGIHLHHLEQFSRLTALTELSIEVTLVQPGAPPLSVAGVSCLVALPHLQALSLPQLEEGEREALAALTRLTRLDFTAAGKSAVGPSLLPLAPRLLELSVSLAHKHEHFIVAYPRVEWASLRALTSLRRLTVAHLAAYTFFAAPEVTWSDEASTAHEADLLVAALSEVRAVELSGCRSAGCRAMK
ncbi:disease resistance protein isoform B [Micractinium conductrix]|uniref:Disease resistance protein isoform B n=1 Tax=Micractinium conductrix TaxID=554055 RepID=A0A2P6VRR4_9CHLO|nr:disease resistance protein isoform B [Micractinium conductrix]|eukprot:PSC76760.1 disease resistance protein isoform B [Micractinium conductrix]